MRIRSISKEVVHVLMAEQRPKSCWIMAYTGGNANIVPVVANRRSLWRAIDS
jgi:hypothetical protein